MTYLNILLATITLFNHVLAFTTEYGLLGLPAQIYSPICATSCHRSFTSLTLSCSQSDGVTLGMVTFQTSTECYASNTPFLTSVAWCARTKCAGKEIEASEMEYWWEQQITGQKAAGVDAVPAKWSYAQAVGEVEKVGVPRVQLTEDDTMLNRTSLVAEETYESQYRILYGVQREGYLENVYGIAILITGFGLPVVLTWLGFVPVISSAIARVRPYLVWPSTISRYHVQPLPYLLGNVPTIGQSLYIVIFIVLNVILTAVGYQNRAPNAWHTTGWREIMSFVLSRTGNFAYIMMPLLFLFAGRSNVPLWMTNWSHSTYLLLHRWVARVFTLQALLHSIIALVLYVENGMYDMEHNAPYWIWGIVATICVVVLCFGSGLYVRKLWYETFLVIHIVLSVIMVVGCWYHAYDLYADLGGYVYWVYAVAAVWAFDRFARLIRILIEGPKRAMVTDIGDAEDGFVRIDVSGIRWSDDPGRHAYLYFPTITPLTPWENHPFSVMPTVLLRRSPRGSKYTDDESAIGLKREDSGAESSENHDGAKVTAVRSRVNTTEDQSHSFAGLTFFIRRSSGLTKGLLAHKNLLTFIEGPYPNNSTTQAMQCNRLLLIGGGIGITALVPFATRHWNARLCWSLREKSRSVAEELGDFLRCVDDKEIRIGKRFDIAVLLAQEAEAGWRKVGVIVSGPGALCDDARAAVVEAAKRSPSTVFELEVEAYSW